MSKFEVKISAADWPLIHLYIIHPDGRVETRAVAYDIAATALEPMVTNALGEIIRKEVARGKANTRP